MSRRRNEGNKQEQSSENLPRRSLTRTRSSHIPKLQLRAGQAANMASALEFSAALGLEPNRTIDIHFNQGGLDLDRHRPQAALGCFLKLAREWISCRGGDTAYIWVLENRRHSGSPFKPDEREVLMGVHVHLLIHVPQHLTGRFSQLQRGWLTKAGMSGNAPRTIKGTRLPTQKAVRGKFLYMLKDLNPEAMADFQAWSPVDGEVPVILDTRGKPSDMPIMGQKAGTSRNIGLAARKRAGRAA
jgi:hypothetical protein